jgi:hypothetical protein
MRLLCRLSLITLLLLTTSLLPEAGYAQYADQLGRLFSTPRERAELDEIRRIFLQDAPPGESLELPGIEIEAEVRLPPPDDLYLMLDGTARRADGSYSLWINNEKVDQHQLPSNVRLARLGDLIVLWVNYLDKLYVVRPGQVLHFASETVYEPYLLPAELANLILPAPEPVAMHSTAAPVTNNAAVTPVNPSSPLPTGLLPGAEVLGGLLENVSRISATLNTIQELTQ